MTSESLVRWKWPILVGGLIIAAAFIATGVATGNYTIFWRSYLFAYLLCLGVSLGGLVLIMLHNLTGGAWGDHVRPLARASSLLLPLMAVLFIPLCFGLQALYPWARPWEVASHEYLAHRQPYLNPMFFYGRAAGYFIIWNVLAFIINRPGHSHRGLSAAGLILYLMTMTHAGMDWIMSRDSEFFSTAFGFIITVGQTLSALAFSLVVMPFFRLPPRWHKLPDSPIGRPLLNDLGNLLMTLVILWAYVSFMQLLVIWMGNLREDNSWYLERGLGGGGDSMAWRGIGLGLVVFHFLVPFYLLLFRAAKQFRPSLAGIAWMLLLAHVVEEYWMVAPSGHGDAAIFDPHWLDLEAFLAFSAVWFAGFLFLKGRQAPEGDAPPSPAHVGEPAHD